MHLFVIPVQNIEYDKLNSEKLLGLLQFQSQEIIPPQTFVHIVLLAEKNWGSNKVHNLVLVYRKAV